MFLIANAAQTLARCDCAEREKGPRSKLERVPTEKLGANGLGLFQKTKEKQDGNKQKD